MKIYTGYFAKLKEYENAGLTPVAICGFCPNFYKGMTFKKFAPSWDIFSKWKYGELDNNGYTERFKSEILKKLDKEQIKQKIESFGENVILLCYEKPEDFCHRHIVAEWITNELNIKCIEFEV